MNKRNPYWYNQYNQVNENENNQLVIRNKRFYNTARWRKLSTYILNTFPICEHCEDNPSEDVHHVIQLSTVEGWNKRLDLDNLKALCKSCHSLHSKAERTNTIVKPTGKQLLNRLNDFN